MDAYLKKGIKEIITEFPEVETILNDYDIGCGPCNVGICLLKDIVSIHQLSVEQEKELMERIAAAVEPGKSHPVPKMQKRATPAPPETRRYSPPLKKLVDEHVLIKRWIALIPEFVDALDLESEQGKKRILDGIDMIRSFADKYHHAKEEEILFKYFDETADILKVMHEDHTRARALVKAMQKALAENDKKTLSESLTAYRELLAEHIRKEDEILYPWMDNQLTDRQVGELFARFARVDEESGIAPETYEGFVRQLEAAFQRKENGS